MRLEIPNQLRTDWYEFDENAILELQSWMNAPQKMPSHTIQVGTKQIINIPIQALTQNCLVVNTKTTYWLLGILRVL